ncbi:LPS assembly lipoprotein LptE [Oceanimonas sp. CHS3-5]|uniref:LPS-assembly lipoprotein LptE n=1 Tax=Oceanimonas sp. CHS3-5 TaxID=3068186 RepID=UPI0027402A5B|nr:LPS assembly lipoprotein LptE [Oceanimonas sp. CHS3-5]MDP5292672.1 LPS assembly lipoprotein LptE [Oceanimonas sp. CHS3-5]
MLTRIKAIVLLSLTLMLITGCGFQLRSGDNLPPELQRLVLSGDDKTQFYRLVSARLLRAGVVLVENDGDTPVLTISGVGQANTTASVNPRGDTLEYAMRFGTRFTLDMPDEPRQVFNVAFNRSFLDKSAQALASSREQQQLREQMEHEAAEQILRQLSRLSF